MTRFRTLSLSVVMATVPALAFAQEAPQLGTASVADIVDAMTVEEKAQLLVGMGFRFTANPEKGFAKTRLLQPGESQTVSFTITRDDLACYDTERAAWIVGPGSYTVAIGASSRDIRLRASIDWSRERVVQQVESRLTPVEPVPERKP